MLCLKTHSHGFFRALPKQRLEPPSGCKASFVSEVNEMRRALDTSANGRHIASLKTEKENSKTAVIAQLTSGQTSDDMRSQIERWENEGGRVSFIEKQSGRFKTGIATAEKEMAGMSIAVTDDGIGIPEQDLRESARVLAQLIADAHVIFHKLRNYHWNVRGMHFSELHSLFERQYELIASRIDEAAERIRQLGYPAPGTMTDFLQLTKLTEYPGDYPNASVMVGNILEDHEALVRYMRREIEAQESCKLDIGTVDFLTSVIRDHEKMAWMMRATLSVVGEPALKADNKGSRTTTEYFLHHSAG